MVRSVLLHPLLVSSIVLNNLSTTNLMKEKKSKNRELKKAFQPNQIKQLKIGARDKKGARLVTLGGHDGEHIWKSTPITTSTTKK